MDKSAVDVLSRLFLARVKSLILARARGIAEHSPLGTAVPVLWPITGDKVPTVFVCNRHGCDHLNEQISYLAQNVSFEINGQGIATIRRGNYCVGPFLSPRRRELYTIMSQLSRSAGKA